MGAHVLAPRPTEIIVSIGNIDDASAGHGSHVPVSLDQHTPAPAPGLDAGLDAGRVGELEAWAHRPGAVRQGQADHDQRLVEPFLPGRDTQIFTVYDTHPDYAHALFAPAIDGLTPPPPRLSRPGMDEDYAAIGLPPPSA